MKSIFYRFLCISTLFFSAIIFAQDCALIIKEPQVFDRFYPAPKAWIYSAKNEMLNAGSVFNAYLTRAGYRIIDGASQSNNETDYQFYIKIMNDFPKTKVIASYFLYIRKNNETLKPYLANQVLTAQFLPPSRILGMTVDHISKFALQSGFPWIEEYLQQNITTCKSLLKILP